jgi:hypothetical protein
MVPKASKAGRGAWARVCPALPLKAMTPSLTLSSLLPLQELTTKMNPQRDSSRSLRRSIVISSSTPSLMPSRLSPECCRTLLHASRLLKKQTSTITL